MHRSQDAPAAAGARTRGTTCCPPAAAAAAAAAGAAVGVMMGAPSKPSLWHRRTSHLLVPALLWAASLLAAPAQGGARAPVPARGIESSSLLFYRPAALAGWIAAANQHSTAPQARSCATTTPRPSPTPAQCIRCPRWTWSMCSTRPQPPQQTPTITVPA